MAFEHRRRVLAALFLLGVSPAAFAAGGGDPKEKEADSDKKDESLTCGKEIVGDWLIEFDAHKWRIMSDTAEIEWLSSVTLDKILTTKFYIEVEDQHMSSAGYMYEDKAQIWYNAPDIELESSYGKAYSVFGEDLGHSYHRSVGFGTKRYWTDKNEFWYPDDKNFTTKMSLGKPKIAAAFGKALRKSSLPLRLELYAPNWSRQNPIAIGKVLDMKGLRTAAKVAEERRAALAEEMMECAIPDVPDFLPPEKEGCYLTTATVGCLGLADDCWELRTLRRFRDNIMRETNAGRLLVDEYYTIAPNIVENIEARSDAQQIWMKTWAFGVVPASILARLGFSGAAMRVYRKMTQKLEDLTV